jgi:hypothetical protein
MDVCLVEVRESDQRRGEAEREDMVEAALEVFDVALLGSLRCVSGYILYCRYRTVLGWNEWMNETWNVASKPRRWRREWPWWWWLWSWWCRGQSGRSEIRAQDVIRPDRVIGR